MKSHCRRAGVCAVAAGFIGLLTGGMPLWAEEPCRPHPPSDQDVEMVTKVAAEFFRTAPRVEGWAWPPLVCIAETCEVNAFANVEELEPDEKPNWPRKKYPKVVWLDIPYSDNRIADALQAENGEEKEAKFGEVIVDDNGRSSQPYIYILQGILDEIIQGDEGNFADLFGHELSHIILRHRENYGVGGDPPLIDHANRRKLEADADELGMHLTFQAGYTPADVARHMKAWIEYDKKIVAKWGPDYDENKIRTLQSSHPGWLERAAKVDKLHPKFWSSIVAFKTGVYLLMAQNYYLAEGHFTQVAEEVPSCYEAFANRGYCRLMQYCDKLAPDELREMNLGQLVAGGFYDRAETIERGKPDEELWIEAVLDLRMALQINPSLILPKAHLALAYLVRSAGKVPDKVPELFEEILAALQDESSAEKLSSYDRAAILNNAAVTAFAAGENELSLGLFSQAEALEVGGLIAEALLFNRAYRLAKSSEEKDRRLAAELFGRYLGTTNSASAWWDLAYDHYQKLCESEEIECQSREQFVKSGTLNFRPVLSVDLGGGKLISLNDPLKSVIAALGEGKTTALVRRTNIDRLRYDDRGFELLVIDKVLGIRLRHPKAPPLVLQVRGVTGKRQEIRVGMNFDEVLKLMEAEKSNWDQRYGTTTTMIYHYFPRLGFGLEVTREGMVSEIIVAQIPYEARIDYKPPE